MDLCTTLLSTLPSSCRRGRYGHQKDQSWTVNGQDLIQKNNTIQIISYTLFLTICVGLTKICSIVIRCANKVTSCVNEITRCTKYTKSLGTIASATVPARGPSKLELFQSNSRTPRKKWHIIINLYLKLYFERDQKKIRIILKWQGNFNEPTWISVSFESFFGQKVHAMSIQNYYNESFPKDDANSCIFHVSIFN